MPHWVDEFPGSRGPVVDELLQRLRQLKRLESWAPEHGLLPRRGHVLHWAHVLLAIDNLAGHDDLVGQMCEEILAADVPRPETFAELSGAALCVALGADGGDRLERSTTRTADWRLRWPPGVTVDVEITVAEQKREHVRRRESADRLLSQVAIDDRSDDLIIHALDPADDQDALIRVVNSIESGQSVDRAGSWTVHRVPPSRDTAVVYQGFDPSPPWWPSDVLRSMNFRQVVAGPGATRAPSQARVLYGVPAVAYINPVMRKAGRPQGEPGLPFLLAVNVSGLPGAFQDLPPQIEAFFPQWTRVSGILLFVGLPATDRSGWWWRLLSNPHAAAGLPEALTHERANLGQTLETRILFAPDAA